MGLASASGLETALKVAKKVYDAVQQVGGVGTRSEISSSGPPPIVQGQQAPARASQIDYQRSPRCPHPASASGGSAGERVSSIPARAVRVGGSAERPRASLTIPGCRLGVCSRSTALFEHRTALHFFGASCNTRRLRRRSSASTRTFFTSAARSRYLAPEDTPHIMTHGFFCAWVVRSAPSSMRPRTSLVSGSPLAAIRSRWRTLSRRCQPTSTF